MQEISLAPYVKTHLCNRIPEKVHSFPQQIWRSRMGSQALKDCFQSSCSSQLPIFSPTTFYLNQLAVLCLPQVRSGRLFSKEIESGTFGEGAGTPEKKLPHSSIKRVFSISALPNDKFSKWHCPHPELPGSHPLQWEGFWNHSET